jgi:hypothetical protein
MKIDGSGKSSNKKATDDRTISWCGLYFYTLYSVSGPGVSKQVFACCNAGAVHRRVLRYRVIVHASMVFSQRSAFDQNHEYSMKTAFLQMMDKVRSQKIIVVAATNHSIALDPALKRRLPRRYTLQPPEAESRKEILQKLLKHEPGNHDVDWLVEETDGLTGAELTEIYFAAATIRNEALAENDTKIDEIKSSGVSKLPVVCKSHWERALKILDGDASDAEDADDTEPCI